MITNELIYFPLKEEEVKPLGWDKDTVQYVLNHKEKTMNDIRSVARSLNPNIGKQDIEDLYQELLDYLYGATDYDVDIALERSKMGKIVTLEGFVHVCIKYVTLRIVTGEYKKNKHTVHDTVTSTNSKSEDKELSLFDTIGDEASERELTDGEYELNDMCKAFEHMRYKFGVDIFTIWFVRLKTIKEHKEDKQDIILKLLGIDRRTLTRLSTDTSRDGVMISIARGVTQVDTDRALDIIAKYTFGVRALSRVVENI